MNNPGYVSGIEQSHLCDLYFRTQPLAISRLLLDLPDDIHTFDDPAEGRKALAVGVPFPSKVKLGLVADTDEEFG